MDFSEARSFNDGIEFYGKDIIIIATRKDDKVKIEKSKSPRLKYSNKFVKTIICLLLTIISNLILNTFQDFKVQILLSVCFYNISSYYDFINFMYMWNFIYSYIDFKNLMDCL